MPSRRVPTSFVPSRDTFWQRRYTEVSSGVRSEFHPAEMGRLKKTAKNFAGIFPPIGRVLADREALREENSALQQEIARLTRELKAAKAKLFAPSRQPPEMWAPPGHFYSPLP